MGKKGWLIKKVHGIFRGKVCSVWQKMHWLTTFLKLQLFAINQVYIFVTLEEYSVVFTSIFLELSY